MRLRRLVASMTLLVALAPAARAAEPPTRTTTVLQVAAAVADERSAPVTVLLVGLGAAVGVIVGLIPALVAAMLLGYLPPPRRRRRRGGACSCRAARSRWAGAAACARVATPAPVARAAAPEPRPRRAVATAAPGPARDPRARTPPRRLRRRLRRAAGARRRAAIGDRRSAAQAPDRRPSDSKFQDLPRKEPHDVAVVIAPTPLRPPCTLPAARDAARARPCRVRAPARLAPGARRTARAAARQRRRPAGSAGHRAVVRPARAARRDPGRDHRSRACWATRRSTSTARVARSRSRWPASRTGRSGSPRRWCPRRRWLAPATAARPTARPRASSVSAKVAKQLVRRKAVAATLSVTPGGPLLASSTSSCAPGSGAKATTGFWTDGHLQCADGAGGPQAYLVEPDFTTATADADLHPRLDRLVHGRRRLALARRQRRGRGPLGHVDRVGERHRPVPPQRRSRRRCPGPRARSPSRPARASPPSASTRSSTGSAASPTTSGSTSTRGRPAPPRPAEATSTARY